MVGRWYVHHGRQGRVPREACTPLCAEVSLLTLGRRNTSLRRGSSLHPREEGYLSAQRPLLSPREEE